VQSAVLRGEFDGLAPLTQYNPQGVFIALEEAGYTLMAVTLLFAGPRPAEAEPTGTRAQNADPNHGCAGVSNARISAMETAAIHTK
jgi:hypothetical protein